MTREISIEIRKKKKNTLSSYCTHTGSLLIFLDNISEFTLILYAVYLFRLRYWRSAKIKYDAIRSAKIFQTWKCELKNHNLTPA